MHEIEICTFEDGLVATASELVEAVEQLERIRGDARTTALLVRARAFLGEVETYFAGEAGR